MQELFSIWLSLLASLAVIGVAGARLSRYGDIIAEKSGFSRGWVGLILLATVTSLPELVTGISAGIWLPFIAKDLATAMAWEQSFVGTLFVAAITSAPEVAVTVAALRMGAVDLAIGNLFGSNLFNIAILAIDDLAYLTGPLFADVSISHVASAFSAMMMSGLAVVGLVLRPPSRVFRTVSWISLLLLVIYLLNTLFLYLYGH